MSTKGMSKEQGLVRIRARKDSILFCLEQQRQTEEREQELSKRLYCRNCQHIGLVEEFPFDLPESDPDYKLHRERRCPRCYSDNNINLASIEMCRQCDQTPATQHGLCGCCAAQMDDAFQFTE